MFQGKKKVNKRGITAGPPPTLMTNVSFPGSREASLTSRHRPVGLVWVCGGSGGGRGSVGFRFSATSDTGGAATAGRRSVATEEKLLRVSDSQID